jgi:HEAT repeat protein
MKNNIAISALMLIALGCGSNQRMGMKLAPPPAPPPAVPEKRDVPLDPALQSEAKDQIMNGMRSSDPILRANSIEAAQDVLGSAEAGDAIVAALSDADPLVRFAASMACGQLKLQAAYPRLVELASDRDMNVQVGALFALHRLGDTSRSHDFEKLARYPDAQVRGNTAMALGLLHEPTAVNVLRAMQSDQNMAVRLQVAEAMWRLGDDEGLQTLVAGTVSGYGDDQAICVMALAGPRDQRAAGNIRGKLTSDYPEVSLVAARAMGMLGSDEGYGVAINGAKNVDPRLKTLAALAFGQIGRSDAQEYLAPMLKDESAPVRLAAATALLQLKIAQGSVASTGP